MLREKREGHRDDEERMELKLFTHMVLINDELSA